MREAPFSPPTTMRSLPKRLLEKKVSQFLLELFVVLYNCQLSRENTRFFVCTLCVIIRRISLHSVVWCFQVFSVTRPEHEIESNSKIDELYDDEQSNFASVDFHVLIIAIVCCHQIEKNPLRFWYTFR